MYCVSSISTVKFLPFISIFILFTIRPSTCNPTQYTPSSSHQPPPSRLSRNYLGLLLNSSLHLSHWLTNLKESDFFLDLTSG